MTPLARAWLVLGFAASPFLAIIGYSQRGVFIEWRQQRAEDAVYEEIAALGPQHPWAGYYYAGDGLGFNTSVSLAPKSGYVFTRFGDGGPWSETEIGSVVETNAGVQARRPAARELSKPLVPVTWGKRRYLIPRDELDGFANAVNLGDEPRTKAQGSFYMRAGDESLPAKGRPALPPEASALLRDRPLNATIIAVGADTFRSDEIMPGWIAKSSGTLVLLDIGRRQGALPGLALALRGNLPKAFILRVGEKSSTALYWREDFSPDRPKRGWVLSTHYTWKRQDRLDDASSPQPPPTVKERRRRALEAKRDAMPYEIARQRVWDQSAAKALGVTVDVWIHLFDARIEYLPAEARAVLQRYMGLTGRVGTVRSGLHDGIPSEAWDDHIRAIANPELAALKASNPKAQAELERLNHEIEATF